MILRVFDDMMRIRLGFVLCLRKQHHLVAVMVEVIAVAEVLAYLLNGVIKYIMD